MSKSATTTTPTVLCTGTSDWAATTVTGPPVPSAATATTW